MEIYLLKADQPHGPYSLEEVQRMLKAGEMTATDLVWHSGLAEWTVVKQVIPPAVEPSPPVPAVFQSEEVNSGAPCCRACGAANVSGANFCSNCGTRIEVPAMPPPLPAAIASNSEASLKQSKVNAWFETIRKRSDKKTIWAVALWTFLIVIVIPELIPKKPPSVPEEAPVNVEQAQYVEKLSHFNRIDTNQFELKAGRWASTDVRVNWKSGQIMRVPTQGELEDFADQRWNVFKISDECQQLLRPDMDMDSAKDCWVNEYKRIFIRELKPLVQEARRESAPAF